MSEDRAPLTAEHFAELFRYEPPPWAAPGDMAHLDRAEAEVYDKVILKAAGLDFNNASVRETVLRTCYALLELAHDLSKEASRVGTDPVRLSWRTLASIASKHQQTVTVYGEEDNE